MLAGRAVRQQLRRQELIEEDLVNPDPEERKIALGTLDPDLPEDLALLRTAIENDPDPGVRAEAALQLGFGERSNVTGVLQKALADTDSEVLINALESAAWVEDRSAKFRVKKLLDHPDEDVREAAADALRDLK
jgi:HEAT repeat protein